MANDNKGAILIALVMCCFCVCSSALLGIGAAAAASPAPAPAPAPAPTPVDDDDDEKDVKGADSSPPAATVEKKKAVEPAAANLPKLSTNGRCGPAHGKTRCGGKACCSQWGWCGGEKGKKSAWCSKTTMGHWGGEYDGTD